MAQDETNPVADKAHQQPVSEPANITGLALSGGGIRSATFCLGVLQALANRDRLKKFDYLSVVSGGSWTGSSLSWFWSQHKRKEDWQGKASELDYGFGPEDFPYNTKTKQFTANSMDPSKNEVWLRGNNLTAWLRSRAKVISPGFGFGILALLGAVFRAIFINLLVFLPLLTVIFAGLRAFNQTRLLDRFLSSQSWLDWMIDLPPYQQVYLLIVLLYLAVIILYALLSRLTTWLSSTMYRGNHKESIYNFFFKFRGIFTKRFGSLTGILLVSTAFVTFPIIENYLSTLSNLSNKEIWSGLLAVISGVTSWVSGTKAKNNDKQHGALKAFLIPVSSALFLYAIMFTFYLLSCHLPSFDVLWNDYKWLLVLWLLVAYVPDINFNSMHRYYRDRLMVAFLPDPVLKTKAPNFSDHFKLSHLQSINQYNIPDEFAPDNGFMQKAKLFIMSFFKHPMFTAKDVIQTEWRYLHERRRCAMNNPMSGSDESNVPLQGHSKLASFAGWLKHKDYVGNRAAPYLLINTTLTTTDSQDRKLRGRGFAHFLLSGNYVGSDATGYRLTREYLDDGLTLATAMGISGAAVDPNTYATKNRFLSILMGLFNVRTGYWAPNPNSHYTPYVRRNVPFWIAAIYREMNGIHLNEKNKFVHLSDGGHSDNLGIYELIRRHTRFILAIDAGADKEWKWDDFGRVVEQVRVDFGVKIEIQDTQTTTEGEEWDIFNRVVEQMREDFGVSVDIEDTLSSTRGKESDKERVCSEAFKKIHPNIHCEGLKYDVSERPWLLAKITYPPIHENEEDNDIGWLLLIKSTVIPDKLSVDVHAYKRKHGDFPDQSTADQFFDEMQFEAYRQLGFNIGESVMDNAPSGIQRYF